MQSIQFVRNVPPAFLLPAIQAVSHQQRQAHRTPYLEKALRITYQCRNNKFGGQTAGGAIAYDKVEVKAGNAEDQPSKDVANSTAMDYCRRNGGKECRIAISYYNQCVSVAQPTEGLGNIQFATAAEQSDADRRALQACGSGCVTVLRKCSLPRQVN